MELPQDYTKLTGYQRRQCREKYIERQSQLCYHCKSDIFSDPPKEITDKPIIKAYFPPNFLDNPIHLHHNHDTGLTIGAVHAYCNAVLWQYHGE